jgi:hypothetical protein
MRRRHLARSRRRPPAESAPSREPVRLLSFWRQVRDSGSGRIKPGNRTSRHLQPPRRFTPSRGGGGPSTTPPASPSRLAFRREGSFGLAPRWSGQLSLSPPCGPDDPGHRLAQ